MTPRLRLTSNPVGSYGPDFKPGFRARQQQRAAKALERTPEERAAADDRREAFMRSQAAVWGVAPDLVGLWIADPAGYRAEVDRRAAQKRAITAIKDREAKAAVEGDTDLNHDNVEAAE